MIRINSLNLNQSNFGWLEERTILLAPTGSYAYGTNTADSDKDYKGVCIPPVDYYLGLESFNEYNNSGGKNFKNTKDDIDINIIHINKFVKDAMQGVPNNIEILFVDPKSYVKITELGQMLVDNRKLFLSKQVQKRFGGFAYSQLKQLENRKSRKDLINQQGYDTKYAYHSVRLLTSAIEILKTGDYSTYRPNRGELLDIRNGKYTFNEVVKLIKDLDNKLKEVSKLSNLPDTVDYNQVNNLLIKINRKGLYLE